MNILKPITGQERFCMAAMLHARNNTILFLWDKMFIPMQNIFIVPGIQHGRHAKPL